MNARESIREYLLVRRMKHWVLVAQYPLIGKGCPVWRARKNYWALLRKYPVLAARHGLNETSVF